MNYEFFPDLILRTPAFSIDEINKNFIDFLRDARFQEALLIANPDLFIAVIDRKGLVDLPLKLTLIRYYNRMCYRCTPFGLFAGCSIAGWSDKTMLRISSKEIQRRTRLDKGFYNNISSRITQLAPVFNGLHVKINNTLYKSGNDYRMIERDPVHGDLRITSIENNDALNYILQIIANGTTSINALIQSAQAFGFSKNESSKFLHMMFENQILFPANEKALSTHHLLSELSMNLANLKNQTAEVANWRRLLLTIETEMETMDKSITGNQKGFGKILDTINEYRLHQPTNRIIQVDYAHCQPAGTISVKIKRALQKSLELLSRISVVDEHNEILQAFKSKFYKKYELQEVSLLEALDPDFGIDYLEGTSFFDNFLSRDFMINAVKSGRNKQELNYNHKHLVAKYDQAIIHDQTHIELTDDDLYTMEDYDRRLSPTISIFFKIYGDDKIYVENAGGSSAMNLFSRFTDFNKSLYDIAKNIAEHEQQAVGDIILAEVIHEPEPRSANVNVFPNVRDYVIPYLTEPSVAADKQIALSDLWLSIKNDEFVLRSKKLDRFVIPMISSAYNYHKGSPIFRFLGDLQNQNKTALNFDFSILVPDQKFYPRLFYKNIILSAATWQIKYDDIPVNDPKLRFDSLRSHFKHRRIPTIVTINEGDNELLINIDREPLADILFDHLRKKKVTYVKEFLFEEERYPIVDERGQLLNNQMIALLYANNKDTLNFKRGLTINKPLPFKRNFSLGSEWLYYKFYGGVISCDKFLIGPITQLINHLINSRFIKSFFFIRYNDPDPHIRLRLQLKNMDTLPHIIEAVRKHTSDAEQSGQIWKIQTDTYKREIERYGVAMAESEQLFEIDSISILKLLSLPNVFKNPEIRFSAAIRLVNDLLSAFTDTIDVQIQICYSMRAFLRRDCRIDATMDKNINMQYRLNQEQYLQYLKPNTSKFEKIFQVRSKKLTMLSKQVTLKAADQHVPEFMQQISGSYIHMCVNRIFPGNQKIYEYIIYDYLFKYYSKKKNLSVKSI